MDLVRVLSRQYSFFIFEKKFSRNTPPLVLHQVDFIIWSIVRFLFFSAARGRTSRADFAIKKICTNFFVQIAQLANRVSSSQNAHLTCSCARLCEKFNRKKIFYFFFKNLLTNRSICGIINTERGRDNPLQKKIKNFLKTP
jgi:hypothetical protein